MNCILIEQECTYARSEVTYFELTVSSMLTVAYFELTVSSMLTVTYFELTLVYFELTLTSQTEYGNFVHGALELNVLHNCLFTIFGITD